MADECDEPRKEVDVLIGSNFYWSFVTGDVVKSSEGPVAVDSKLGWFLSRPIDSHEMDVSHTCLVIRGVPANLRFDEKMMCWPICCINFGMLNPLEFFLLQQKILQLVYSHQRSPFTIIGTRLVSRGSWITQRSLIICHYARVARRVCFASFNQLLEYNKIIQDQLQAGIIESVQPDLTNGASGDNLPVD